MNNPYKELMLDLASKLDAVSKMKGELTRACLAVSDDQDRQSTAFVLNTVSNIKKSDASKEINTLCTGFVDSVMKFFGYIYVSDLASSAFSEEDEKSLPELLDDLNALIGLSGVKEQVNTLIAYQRVQRLRKQYGLFSQKGTMHLAFVGNPGTGKTTVARIVGRIYKQLGLLSKGHFTEVSRTDLIAGYQGQTALKVKKVIEEAKGGVLFIDEAYSITENDHSDSYGRECLTELTKALEDYRDDLVVIVAGYSEPMKHFFESNPGLKSRINTVIEFPDYTGDELYAILLDLCRRNSYTLSPECADLVKAELTDRANEKEHDFANGRMVRNMFDELVMNHAKRVDAMAGNVDRLMLEQIEAVDFKPSASR